MKTNKHEIYRKTKHMVLSSQVCSHFSLSNSCIHPRSFINIIHVEIIC